MTHTKISLKGYAKVPYPFINMFTFILFRLIALIEDAATNLFVSWKTCTTLKVFLTCVISSNLAPHTFLKRILDVRLQSMVCLFYFYFYFYAYFHFYSYFHFYAYFHFHFAALIDIRSA
jgi:hypothetical protein